MSFASPSRLLLIVVPLGLLGRVPARAAIAAQVRAALHERRPARVRGAAPARMAATHLGRADAVRAARARRRRSLARRATIRVARQRGTIMLAIDTSGSMSATDVSPSRLLAAEDAARRFVDKLPPGLKVGLLSFDSDGRILAAPTSDHSVVLSAIKNLQVGGGTATGAAIFQSLDAIAAQPRAANGKKAAAAIVLMSDGAPTIGRAGESPEADRHRGDRGGEDRRRTRSTRSRSARPTARSRSRAKWYRSRRIRRRWPRSRRARTASRSRP